MPENNASQYSVRAIVESEARKSDLKYIVERNQRERKIKQLKRNIDMHTVDRWDKKTAKTGAGTKTNKKTNVLRISNACSASNGFS